jgi:hypothetical protein
MEHWWQYLNERKVYPGVETLSWSASEELTKLWKAWKQDHPWPAGIEHEQAIYHFGVSELTGEMLAYAHVSWDGFAAEEMSFRVRGQAMVFAKPNCTMPSVEAMSEFPRLFVPMMEEQRTLQATKGYGPDHSGEVTIGGELIVHHLNAYGCSVYKLARFDDYSAVESGLWGDFRAKYAASHPAASEPVHVLPDACVVAAEVEAERVRGEEFAQALVAVATAAGKSPEQWSRDVLVDAVVRSVSSRPGAAKLAGEVVPESAVPASV